MFTNTWNIHPQSRKETHHKAQKKSACVHAQSIGFWGYKIIRKSRKLAADSFGANIAAASGVFGGHLRITHDTLTTFVVNIAKENCAPIRGGGFGFVQTY
jgi:hypothetical protein